VLPHKDDISLLHQIEQQTSVDWRPVHELKEAVRQSAFQARDEIHVWRANADLFRQADLESWLSDGEKERVRCFKFEQDRQRYVAAHAMLKQLLLAYTGLTAQQIEIKQALKGKPYLANLPSGIHLRFNLSHSGKAIVCIFSSRFEVGIDVENMQNSIDWLLIAERYFTVK
jgi:4'-phosphopantetheinyl transferase